MEVLKVLTKINARVPRVVQEKMLLRWALEVILGGLLFANGNLWAVEQASAVERTWWGLNSSGPICGSFFSSLCPPLDFAAAYFILDICDTTPRSPNYLQYPGRYLSDSES